MKEICNESTLTKFLPSCYLLDLQHNTLERLPNPAHEVNHGILRFYILATRISSCADKVNDRKDSSNRWRKSLEVYICMRTLLRVTSNCKSKYFRTTTERPKSRLPSMNMVKAHTRKDSLERKLLTTSTVFPTTSTRLAAARYIWRTSD